MQQILGYNNVSKRETDPVTVVPRTKNSIHSCRPRNGMESLCENIKESMPSALRIVLKNTEMSRPSSVKPNNGVVSSLGTRKFSSSRTNTIPCLQNDTKKSIPCSRLKNDVDSPKKNTNGSAPPLKNIEKPRIGGGDGPRWPETEEHGGGRANSGEQIGRPRGVLDGAFGGKWKRRSRAFQRNKRFFIWFSKLAGIKAGREMTIEL